MNGVEQNLAYLMNAVANHPQRWLAWASAVTFVIALALDLLPQRRMEKAKRTPPPPLPIRR